MKIKTMDDIEREKNAENREKMKKEISEDINDVVGNIFGKQKKKKRSILKWIAIISLFLLTTIIILNFVLGNIWLLRFFIKSLFGLG
jgi:hypothetical protein